MDEASLVSKFINITGVSTVARAAGLAVDDHLGIKSDWRGCHIIILDVESVSDGGGGTLGPARATILGNVLVLVPR